MDLLRLRAARLGKDELCAVDSTEPNAKKIDKARRFSGFFSIMTHGVDYDAMRTFHSYRLRDEQEKYFQQMKNQMASDRQRNWSEEGKTGRLFILFVSLMLSSSNVPKTQDFNWNKLENIFYFIVSALEVR
jgi:hypothetical protein